MAPTYTQIHQHSSHYLAHSFTQLRTQANKAGVIIISGLSDNFEILNHEGSYSSNSHQSKPRPPAYSTCFFLQREVLQNVDITSKKKIVKIICKQKLDAGRSEKPEI